MYCSNNSIIKHKARSLNFAEEHLKCPKNLQDNGCIQRYILSLSGVGRDKGLKALINQDRHASRNRVDEGDRASRCECQQTSFILTPRWRIANSTPPKHRLLQQIRNDKVLPFYVALTHPDG